MLPLALGMEPAEPTCGSCGVVLDDLRDGTEEDGNRCHNCYWE
eukprot:SAG11_NODE_32415_length_283_cov_3.206522_1_plen_42_part_10